MMWKNSAPCFIVIHQCRKTFDISILLWSSMRNSVEQIILNSSQHLNKKNRTWVRAISLADSLTSFLGTSLRLMSDTVI